MATSINNFMSLCFEGGGVGVSRGHPLPELNTFLFMAGEDNSVPPGDWERYFSELSVHLTGAGGQLGVSNNNFSKYVVDILELFIVNISSLAVNFQLHSNEETAVIGAWYSSHLNELVVCLWSILGQWLDYLKHSHIRTNSSYNDIPRCHNELGPGTEYDHDDVTSLHLRAVFMGSLFRIASRTLHLVTLNPNDRSQPQASVCPKLGNSLLICSS